MCDKSKTDSKLCDVCSSEAAKYTCPRCETKTCSINCVAAHKKEIGCNGERNKTQYKPLSQFTNLDLLSDYRFLEDITRVVDNCKRNPLKRYTRYRQPLPSHLYKLRSASYKRNIKLTYLPQHFTRHKTNTSHLNFKNLVIYWRVDFIFPQGGYIKIVEEKLDENIILSAALGKYMDAFTCPDIYLSHLKFYHAAGVSDIELLLKAELVASDNKFYILDKSLSLKQNLEYKNILEYPVLYIIRKSYKDEYEIIDDDIEVKAIQEFPQKLKLKNFNYFDGLDEVKHKNKKDDLVSKIRSSAKELKNFISPGDEESTESSDSEESMNTTQNKKKELYIPYYNELVKSELI